MIRHTQIAFLIRVQRNVFVESVPADRLRLTAQANVLVESSQRLQRARRRLLRNLHSAFLGDLCGKTKSAFSRFLQSLLEALQNGFRWRWQCLLVIVAGSIAAPTGSNIAKCDRCPRLTTSSGTAILGQNASRVTRTGVSFATEKRFQLEWCKNPIRGLHHERATISVVHSN